MTINGRGPLARQGQWEGRSEAEGFRREYTTFSAASPENEIY